MTPTAWTIARAIAAASRPPVAVSQKPMPTSPPVAAIPRSWSSVRLRPLSAVARTPVCDATTGRVAMPTTSSIVAADAWATSGIRLRASISRTSSRPSGVSPPLAIAVRRPAVRRVEEVRGRDHAEARLDHRVERRQVGAQRVRALDREHARGEARVGRPRLEVRREVLARADEPERALRPGLQPVRPVREEQGARRQAAARCGAASGRRRPRWSRRRCGRRCARC